VLRKILFNLFFLSSLSCLFGSSIFASNPEPLIDTPGKTAGSDFNGDGIHDFIVGAPYNDDGTGNNSGAAYVFYGSTSLDASIDLSITVSAPR